LIILRYINEPPTQQMARSRTRAEDGGVQFPPKLRPAENA